LEAFRAAGPLGADGIELDVRRTADGVGVVLHDAHLSDGRAVVDHSTDAVPSVVPSLAQALEACGGLVVNVEIKNWRDDVDFDDTRRLADWTVSQIEEWGGGERVIVSSFDLGTIDRVRAIDPALSTAWLVVARGEPERLVALAAEHGHAGIHPVDGMVDPDLVETAHAAGLFVNVWTVDDPGRIRSLGEMGVDGVVTNVPDVAAAALAVDA
jgi:glycerophosphoryl diester phosphodiesterase